MARVENLLMGLGVELLMNHRLSRIRRFWVAASGAAIIWVALVGLAQAQSSDKSAKSRPSSKTSSAAKTTPSSAVSAPERSAADRAREWAKELIRKNDKNGDHLLQKSEWANLG